MITMQALSEEDRRLWMEAMDGREPVRRNISEKVLEKIVERFFVAWGRLFAAKQPVTQRLPAGARAVSVGQLVPSAKRIV